MGIEKRKQIRNKIVDLTCGLLAATTDLFLFCLFQSLNVGKHGRSSAGIERSIEDSIDEVTSLGINKETVKKAIWNLTHRKLIKKEDKNTVEITREGINKLSKVIPFYREKRLWNGHFYLVIYDIDEKKRRARRTLREYLKKLGCGLLQDSVWLTPYNPRDILKNFIKENSLSGSIIVSDIGKDGSIGDEKLEELIKRVYKLDEINERYKSFILEMKKNKYDKNQAYFHFLSILKDDPQLPFEILPGDWKGDEAYKLLKERKLL